MKYVQDFDEAVFGVCAYIGRKLNMPGKNISFVFLCMQVFLLWVRH
ncbi:MAG: hypothetical protein LRY27_03790 [Chitinophagales bacterium]|nr:hypothetical protein [Chitinophagales bacterium]